MPVTSSSRRQMLTFVTKLFTNSKNAAGKYDSLLKHELSYYHKNACISYHIQKASLKTPESTVYNKISAQNKHMYDKKIWLRTIIVEPIILYGKQTLAFRSHRDDSTRTHLNKGNFCDILDLLASHDNIWNMHLKRDIRQQDNPK